MLANPQLVQYFITTLLLSTISQQYPINKEGRWKRNEVKDDPNEGPAAKCQDIYTRNKNSPSGYYNINMDGKISKVYCYFHKPEHTVIRQLYSLDGRPQEWNVHVPNGVNDGDPEGAMEMQYEPGDIPEGAGPHFTQPIIDNQEAMYYNKTLTIEKLIAQNNRRERERKKQMQKQNPSNKL